MPELQGYRTGEETGKGLEKEGFSDRKGKARSAVAKEGKPTCSSKRKDGANRNVSREEKE